MGGRARAVVLVRAGYGELTARSDGQRVVGALAAAAPRVGARARGGQRGGRAGAERGWTADGDGRCVVGCHRDVGRVRTAVEGAGHGVGAAGARGDGGGGGGGAP